MNLSIFASEYRKTNTSKRSLLNGSAAVVGLSAVALGWSGLAQASSEEARLQTVLLPDHYSLQEDGVVVFSLTTGEQMTLSEDQYVILDGGLLLIVDELAQNAMTQLPVMGALRTELFMEFQPVRSPDGSIVEASNAQPLWTGEEAAPRLFEQVDIQRFELAQNGSEAETQSGTNIGQITSAAAGGLSLAGLSLASGIIGTEPEAAAEEAPATEPAAEPEPEPEFWTNDDVADSASNSITGTNVNSFVGYTAASKTAVVDPISNFAAAANTGTIDLSAGGNNYVQLGDSLAKSGGKATYTGADQIDVVALSSGNITNGATVTLQMGQGTNTLSSGANNVYSGSTLNYTGGDDSDTVSFEEEGFYYGGAGVFNMGNGANYLKLGNDSAIYGGTITYTGGGDGDTVAFGSGSLRYTPPSTLAMGAGSNFLTIGDTAAYSATGLQYTGGNDDDTIVVGSNALYEGFTLSITAMNGSNSLTVGANAVYDEGAIDYHGGSGVDTLLFGDNLATDPTGSVEINLGAGDTADDIVAFAGAVGTGSGSTVTIQNFNFNDDRIDVATAISATVNEIVGDGLGNLTWTDSNGNHKLVFAGIGPGGTGVVATSAELVAAII